MAPRRPAGVLAPAAHRYLAAAGTASKGSMMFGGPGSPNAVMPQVSHVEGRNCIGPSAPAGDGPLLVPSPLSIWAMAARIVHDMPGQYWAADAWNSSM